MATEQLVFCSTCKVWGYLGKPTEPQFGWRTIDFFRLDHHGGCERSYITSGPKSDHMFADAWTEEAGTIPGWEEYDFHD